MSERLDACSECGAEVYKIPGKFFSIEEQNAGKIVKEKIAEFVEDLKNSFVFKENKYAGIYVYNYEKEATINEIKLSGPVKVSN